MNRIVRMSFVFLFFAATFLSASDRLLIMKIGPTWPRVLWDTEKPTAWDGGIITGVTFDKIISIGGGLDFLWNVSTEETKIKGNLYQIEKQEKTFMFPVSGYIAISPLPDVVVNPCISGQIGLNTMYFSHKENQIDSIVPADSLIDESGMYMGFYWKAAIDAVVKIGGSTGLFAGLEYQWSRPEKLSNNNGNEFIRRDMFGLGIRFGFKAGF